MSKIGQNSMKKWPFFAIILPWMARYGSKRSFLLIFSARDDLVKVSWKSDVGKCQNQLTPPYFDQLSERHQLLYLTGSLWHCLFLHQLSQTSLLRKRPGSKANRLREAFISQAISEIDWNSSKEKILRLYCTESEPASLRLSSWTTELLVGSTLVFLFSTDMRMRKANKITLQNGRTTASNVDITMI